MLPPYLTDADLDALIDRALAEDVGSGDVTTEATVPPGAEASGRIVAKESGIVAGVEVARRVFRAVDAAVDVKTLRSDGSAIHPGVPVARVAGPARAILIGERLALNILQRMSGIATATHRMVEAAQPHTPDILDTRKTAPGLRRLDKWAVRLGGGTNHRIGLFDLILIKDNHIAAAGGIPAALDAAVRYRDQHDPDLAIELETRTLQEVRTACDHGGADILLLDNMVTRSEGEAVDASRLKKAVALVNGRLRTEASGNVTLATVSTIAATGVDAISSGALTHSVTALDLSMQFD